MYSDLDSLKTVISEAELIRLASESSTIDDDAEALIEAQIAKADSTIDLYLRSQYTVPLEEVPDVIEKLSAELTVVGLYRYRSLYPEEIKSLEENCLKTLKMISSGQLMLDVDLEEDEVPAVTMQIASNDALDW